MNIYREIQELLKTGATEVTLARSDLERMVAGWLAMSKKADIIRDFYEERYEGKLRKDKKNPDES